MKKFNSILLTVIMSIAIHHSYAQNLVPNYSFETDTTCPTGSSQIYFATPWRGVTTNSTDYYNACNNGSCGVPSDGVGFQYARTGVAYAGIYAIDIYSQNYREYLQVKLDSTLQHDSCYLVEFYCNLHNASGYVVNKMGAYLSNTAVSTVGPLPNGTVLQYAPQIESHQFLNDTLNWMRIGGYYKANGGEQYITIGNFNTDSTTDTLHILGNNYPGAYYFIDDVTVKKLAGCDSTASVPEYGIDKIFSLYPNPNNGRVLLSYSLKANDKAELLIYDITGKWVNTQQLNSAETQMPISVELLTNGIYFYTIVVNNKIVKRDKLIIIK